MHTQWCSIIACSSYITSALLGASDASSCLIYILQIYTFIVYTRSRPQPCHLAMVNQPDDLVWHSSKMSTQITARFAGPLATAQRWNPDSFVMSVCVYAQDDGNEKQKQTAKKKNAHTTQCNVKPCCLQIPATSLDANVSA